MQRSELRSGEIVAFDKNGFEPVMVLSDQYAYWSYRKTHVNGDYEYFKSKDNRCSNSGLWYRFGPTGVLVLKIGYVYCREGEFSEYVKFLKDAYAKITNELGIDVKNLTGEDVSKIDKALPEGVFLSIVNVRYLVSGGWDRALEARKDRADLAEKLRAEVRQKYDESHIRYEAVQTAMSEGGYGSVSARGSEYDYKVGAHTPITKVEIDLDSLEVLLGLAEWPEDDE